jgi:hypothetical protein
MPIRSCGACQTRLFGKAAGVYWAWYTVADVRLAYRQTLCIGCYAERVAPLQVASEDPTYTCPACHASTVDDNDMVFATIYLPGGPPFRVDMATCGPCAALVRIFAQQGAARLPDRELEAAEARGLGPSASDPWSAYRPSVS